MLSVSLKNVNRVVIKLNTQNPRKALNRVLRAFVKTLISFQIAIVESYDHLGLNFKMCVC